MRIKDDKLLKLLSSKTEPKISIILPVKPETPQIEENILNYKNLLKDVLKDLELNYSRRFWDMAAKNLNCLLLDRQLFSTAKNSLLIFANNEQMEVCELQHKVMPKAHVGTTFLVQDLLLPEENLTKPDYLVNISRDRINVFDIDSLKEVELEGIHARFADYYPDFDAESNVNVGSYGGKNPNFHGHRAKAEEQQKDQTIYYQYLNRALNSLYAKRGYSFILTGLPEVLDVYLNMGNRKYVDGVIHASILNLNHQELLEKVSEYKNFESLALTEKIKHDLHRADNQERLLHDLDMINFALENRDVRELVSCNDGLSYSVEHNKMMVESLLKRINCRVLYSEEAVVPQMRAIVY